MVLGPYFQRTRGLNQLRHNAKWVVAAGTIGCRIGGIEMIAILIGIVLGSSPPGLGKTMLYVTTRDGRAGRTELFPIIAVHVHAIAVFVLIGVVEHFP